MALIKCEECGKEISDKATTCPYCGIETKEFMPFALGSKTQNIKDIQGCLKFIGISFVVLLVPVGLILFWPHSESLVDCERRMRSQGYSTSSCFKR